MRLRLADFGFGEGINEVIAITRNPDGSWNAAPIGIIVEDSNSAIARVRLYKNRTRENLERDKILFANITDDALIFTIASFEDLDVGYFSSLNPPLLKGAMAWCEFEGELKGDEATLRLLDGKVVERKVRAVNRGFSAVIEALVHATRYIAFKDEEKRRELLGRILYYKEIAKKCGGDREKRAFEIIMKKIGIL